jgi:type VI secretion system protein ImpH
VSDLKTVLTRKGREFDFFQAVALLEEYVSKQGGADDPLSSGGVQFVSDTSTAFPPSDIAAIKSDQRGNLRFVLSFMGLLGVSSPLPHYFTEYATRHDQEDSPLADFLAMFNHRLYVLFYRAWRKYRLAGGYDGGGTAGLLQKLSLLSDMGHVGSQLKNRMVAYTGILAGSCRSAEGLRTILAGVFGGIPVAIRQWQCRWSPVRDLKRMGVDTVLGSNAMLGTHIRDTGGTFRVVLGPLEKDAFESFMQDQPDTAMLQEIVRHYCTDSLTFDIEVQLKPAALVPVVLGADSARLGISTSCGTSRAHSAPYSVVITGE